VVNPWRGLTGLPRTSFAIALATFVNRAGVMVRPFLLLYLTKKLGFSSGFAGWIVSLYGATTLVAAPLSGFLSDRLGARFVLRSALVVAALAILAYPIATTRLAVAMATVVFALFNEMPRPALMTLVAEVAPKELRKQAFVLSRLAINLGLSIGPAVGGWLTAERGGAGGNYLALFFVDAGASALAALLLLGMKLPKAAHVERPTGSAIGVLLADRPLLVFWAATTLYSLMFFQHESTLSLYMTRELGLTERHYGLMFTLNTVLIVLFEVELNTRLQHWSHRRSLAVGGALTTLGFGGLFFVHGLVGTPAALAVAAAVVVWTVGEMVGMPAMSAFVVEIAPVTRRGLYMATLTLAFGAGLTAGPKLGTLVYDATSLGPQPLWLMTGVVGLASTLLYGALPRSKPAPRAPDVDAAIEEEEATLESSAT
jgi:MFS family permease